MKNFATVRSRILSGLIDHGLVMTLTVVYISVYGEPNEEGAQHVEGLMSLPLVFFWMIYFPGVEGTTGQTLGKKLMGIRVIKQNGSGITFGSSLVRHLFDFIDISFGVGILVINSSHSKQRIGDQIAKTVVLEDNLALCENCKAELELSAYEQKTGQFICPACKHEHKPEAAGSTAH